MRINREWWERNKDTLDAETRLWAEKALADYERLLERNPLQGWRPAVSPVDGRSKQAEYLESHDFFKLYAGGNGAGKSSVGTVDDLVQLCDRDSVPEHLLRYKRWEPPVPMRVVAPKMNVIESTILEKFRELTPRDQLVGNSFDKAYDKQYRRLRFKNGSFVLFNTGDQDRDAHAGVELRRVRFDEEPEGEHGRGIFTENVARLRKFTPDAQVCFTMTPLFGLSWVYDTIWERREEPGIFCVVASMRDNPHIDADSTIRTLAHLSEEERKAVVEGMFIHVKGAVLTLPADSVVAPITPDHLRGMTVYVGIDPGISRGGVVWTAFDRENSMLVFDELYPEGMTVPEIAQEIRRKNRGWELDDHEVMYVIDPSARNRSLVNAENVEGEFARAGIYCAHGQNDRRAGILQLKARAEQRALRVTSNCEKWLWESRRWLVASDEILAEQKAKVKGDGGSFATIGPDHLMDPTRYIAMERLWFAMSVSASKRYGDVWVPGTAPPSQWLAGRAPREHGPMFMS